MTKNTKRVPPINGFYVLTGVWHSNLPKAKCPEHAGDMESHMRAEVCRLINVLQTAKTFGFTLTTLGNCELTFGSQYNPDSNAGSYHSAAVQLLIDGLQQQLDFLFKKTVRESEA